MGSCTCVKCKVCAGKGEYAVDLSGKYSGPTRFDDLDTYEFCEFCDGSGYTTMCHACRDKQEEERD